MVKLSEFFPLGILYFFPLHTYAPKNTHMYLFHLFLTKTNEVCFCEKRITKNKFHLFLTKTTKVRRLSTNRLITCPKSHSSVMIQPGYKQYFYSRVIVHNYYAYCLLRWKLKISIIGKIIYSINI